MASDRLLYAERVERDEETRMRVGNRGNADIAFQRIDRLRRLPLRARQIDSIALWRAAKHALDEFFDVGRSYALQPLKRHIQPLGANDLKSLRTKIVGHGAVVAL